MNEIHKPGWRRFAPRVAILVSCAGTTTSNRSCSLGGSNNGGDGGDDPTFVAALQPPNSPGRVPDSCDRGATIQMVLTVRNRRDTTETIDFTDSRTRDFVVVRAN